MDLANNIGWMQADDSDHPRHSLQILTQLTASGRLDKMPTETEETDRKCCECIYFDIAVEFTNSDSVRVQS